MCAFSLASLGQRVSGRPPETQDHHLHVAVHHPSGVVRGLLKGLEIGEDLGHDAQQPEHVEVGVGKHWFLLPQALPAQLHYLEGDTASSPLYQSLCLTDG